MNAREGQKFSNKVVDLLKKERIRRNISQYRINTDCSFSSSTLSKIENHKFKPTLSTLKIIADYLNIKLSDILKEAEK